MEKIYPYLMLLFETNYRREIKFRYQAGPGISLNLINGRNNFLRLSLTGTYENTQYGDVNFNHTSDTLSNTISTLRTTGRIFGRYGIVKDKLNFLYELWFQQSLNMKKNSRLYYENILEVPVSKHVSFRSTLRYTHESVHLKGLKPWDLFWVFGLSVSNVQ